MLVRSTILAASVLILAGCDSFSSMLGLERHIPDETQVVTRPPLTLPPDYDLMPPGTPSTVSGEHEAGSSMGGQSTAGVPEQPKKEERGFFGSLFHGDWFGDDVDATTAKKPDQPQTATPDQASPPPDVNGTPQAPAPTAK
jgi:hypothetical protein